MSASAPRLSQDAPQAFGERWLLALRERAQSRAMLIDTSSYDPQAGISPLAWARDQQVPAALVLETTAEWLGVPFRADLAGVRASARFLERVPIAMARQHAVMAIDDGQAEITLAIGRPESWSQLDILRKTLATRLQPVFAPADEILRVINTSYQQRTGQTENVIAGLDRNELAEQIEAATLREDLLDTAGRAPVVKLVNSIFFEAVQLGASDIHFQPYDDRLVVRMRVDGILADYHTLPKDLQEEITSRIKVQGKMNIAEKRLPQDGRATVQVGDRLIDLRIASLPSNGGERVVVRLLDKSARLYTLTEVGMDRRSLDRFAGLIKLEHGMILVTGPTGSGKSTTLYAALQEINTTDRNVLTLEDPIEYEIAGVSQTQINTKKGLTFASGLRNVLRQDPDIIMVGEIRDQETAVMAIQSALTGHLVFSTLHTNDAASAIARLLDLGIEPFLLGSSLLAVLAQRLVRKVCGECKTTRQMTTSERKSLEMADGDYAGATVSQGTGCDACRGTGYKGRTGIYELLIVDEAVRETIKSRATASAIRQAGYAGGMRLLRIDGIDKIIAGMTTIEEVERVTMRAAL